MPWRDIAGYRNVLLHNYLVDLDHVWLVVKDNLPPLKQRVQATLLELQAKQL